MPLDNQKKKPGLEGLPETTRKKIMIFAVSVLMLVILVAYLGFQAYQISQPKKSPAKEKGFESIQQNINEFFTTGKENLDKIKGGFNQLNQVVTEELAQTPTTSKQLSEQEVETIKEKILENNETEAESIN